MKNIIVSIILSFILIGCSTNLIKTSSSNVFKVKLDPFRPEIRDHYVSETVTIQGIVFGSSNRESFRLYFDKANNVDRWFIESFHVGDKWMFISDIKFIFDNKNRTYFSNIAPVRKVNSGKVSEIKVFSIDKEFFDLIKSSNDVAVRLIGSVFYKQKLLTAEDKKIILEFHKYISDNITLNSSEVITPNVVKNIVNENVPIKIVNINKLKINVAEYKDKLIEIDLKFSSIISSSQALFAFDMMNHITVDYSSCSSDIKSILAELKMWEKTIVRGYVTSNYGILKLVAVDIEKPIDKK